MGHGTMPSSPAANLNRKNIPPADLPTFLNGVNIHKIGVNYKKKNINSGSFSKIFSTIIPYISKKGTIKFAYYFKGHLNETMKIQDIIAFNHYMVGKLSESITLNQYY